MVLLLLLRITKEIYIKFISGIENKKPTNAAATAAAAATTKIDNNQEDEMEIMIMN